MLLKYKPRIHGLQYLSAYPWHKLFKSDSYRMIHYRISPSIVKAKYLTTCQNNNGELVYCSPFKKELKRKIYIAPFRILIQLNCTAGRSYLISNCEYPFIGRRRKKLLVALEGTILAPSWIILPRSSALRHVSCILPLTMR